MLSLLLMLLAHVLGDFVFQPKSWVEKRKDHIQYLFYHIAVHAGLLILFFSTDLANNWKNILFLTAIHLALDSGKIFWEKRWKVNPVRIFLIDQALHLASIFGLFFFLNPEVFEQVKASLSSQHLLLYLIAIVLQIFVVPIVIRVYFTKWNGEVEFNNKRKDSLFDAGTLIGILERIMILSFVMLNFMEGIGFLLAAKSIFRFGDLSNARDTKFTEYVLIGTLLSFVLGTLVALALKYSLTLIT